MILNTTSKAVESRQDKTTSVYYIFVYDTVMQGVTNRSKSMIEKLIDISILLDIIRY